MSTKKTVDDSDKTVFLKEIVKILDKDPMQRFSLTVDQWKTIFETELNVKFNKNVYLGSAKIRKTDEIETDFYADLVCDKTAVCIRNAKNSHSTDLALVGHPINLDHKDTVKQFGMEHVVLEDNSWSVTARPDVSDVLSAPRDKLYNKVSAEVAQKNGFTLIQVYEWMRPDVIVSVIRSKMRKDEHKIGARECEMRLIDQKVANAFLRANHINGASNGQKFNVGLFYNSELVHVQTFGPARMNKRFHWEAIRSCTKMNWLVRGAFTKCDKFFFNTVQPDSVLSYVDATISQGHTEKNVNGWEIVQKNQQSCYWVCTEFLGVPVLEDVNVVQKERLDCSILETSENSVSDSAEKTPVKDTVSLFDGLLDENGIAGAEQKEVSLEELLAQVDSGILVPKKCGVKDTLIKEAAARRVSADRFILGRRDVKSDDVIPLYRTDETLISNSDVLHSANYVQVWDAGALAFAWFKDEDTRKKVLGKK